MTSFSGAVNALKRTTIGNALFPEKEKSLDLVTTLFQVALLSHYPNNTKISASDTEGITFDPPGLFQGLARDLTLASQEDWRPIVASLTTLSMHLSHLTAESDKYNPYLNLKHIFQRAMLALTSSKDLYRPTTSQLVIPVLNDGLKSIFTLYNSLIFVEDNALIPIFAPPPKVPGIDDVISSCHTLKDSSIDQREAPLPLLAEDDFGGTRDEDSKGKAPKSTNSKSKKATGGAKVTSEDDENEGEGSKTKGKAPKTTVGSGDFEACIQDSLLTQESPGVIGASLNEAENSIFLALQNRKDQNSYLEGIKSARILKSTLQNDLIRYSKVWKEDEIASIMGDFLQLATYENQITSAANNAVNSAKKMLYERSVIALTSKLAAYANYSYYMRKAAGKS
jgi:hypothetical protein